MRVSLAEIVEKWALSKATVYRAIQMGKLHKGDDGLIDVANVVMLWGEPSAKRIKKKSKTESKTAKIDNNTNERERELLAKVKSLQEALDKAESDKLWLQQQVEANQQVIKLLEFKTTQLPSPVTTKTNLFGRIIKAISNE
jgi:Skp family chaperone for outer membrane proteins